MREGTVSLWPLQMSQGILFLEDIAVVKAVRRRFYSILSSKVDVFFFKKKKQGCLGFCGIGRWMFLEG